MSFLTTGIPEECGEYTQVNEDKWGYQEKDNPTIETWQGLYNQ